MEPDINEIFEPLAEGGNAPADTDAAAKAYIAALKAKLPDNFWGPRPLENFDFYLIYSKEADEGIFQPKETEIVRVKEEDFIIKQKTQNHHVAYDLSTGKIYTYTELSPEPESQLGYTNIEVLGKFDIRKLIRLEDEYGPRNENRITMEMSLLDLTFEEKRRVWEQLCYPVFSSRALRLLSRECKACSTVCDATSGQYYTITSLERKKPSEESLGDQTGVWCRGRMYLQKTVYIGREFGPLSGEDVRQDMMWDHTLFLSKEEKRNVIRAADIYQDDMYRLLRQNRVSKNDGPTGEPHP